ncbi:MAG: glycosyltransferase family 4 protein [Planctomycetaceae bacterium]|nr:glycosyltransferase family 4 protein [Planctomycetaceae bacterium]
MTPPSTIRPLHLFESWRPVVSGYTSRSWDLVNAQLQNPNLDPRVIVTSRQFSNEGNRLDYPPQSAERFRLCFPTRRERWLRKLRPFSLDRRSLERSLDQLVDEWRVDLIHVHWSSHIGRAAARIAKQRDVPLVSEVRFDLAAAMISQTLRQRFTWLEPRFRRLFESHLQESNAIIAAGPSLTEHLKQAFPALQHRIWTVSNRIAFDRYDCDPLDETQRKALGIQGRFVVGTTSKMLYYEGLDLLLRAMAQARSQAPSLHLLLVGDGPEATKLKRLARSLEVPVTFTGPVPFTDIPSLLRQIDLFVIPRRDVSVTRHAGPLKLLEAMASGRAIIAAPVGDIKYLLADGRGFLLPHLSLSCLTKAIIDLAWNHDERHSMGQRARDYADRKLSWHNADDLHRTIYESALKGS